MIIFVILFSTLSSSFAEDKVNIIATSSSIEKRFTQPQKIILVKLNPKISDPEKFAKSLNIMFVDNLKLNQNVFSYIVVDNTIYKTRDLDETYEANNNDDKVAYIAYTNNTPLQLISNLSAVFNISSIDIGKIEINKNKYNISDIGQFMDKLPSPVLDIDASFDKITYSNTQDPGTIQNVKVQFKNKSEMPLIKSDHPNLFVMSIVDGKEGNSSMYVNSDWYSKTRSGELDETRVGKDETGNIIFPILSDVVAGKQTQKFALGKIDGSIIPNSEFEVSIEVNDIHQKLVEIKPNGYGFSNIRDEKKYNGRVIAFMNQGTKLLVTEDDGSWIKVKYEGTKEGWIQSAYVKKLY